MITIRQHCVRCAKPLDYKLVNHDTGVAKCEGCDVVFSIFEHRTFLPPKSMPKPENVEVARVANSLLIDVKGNQPLVLSGFIGGLFIVFFFSLFFIACYPSPNKGSLLFGWFVILIVWIAIFSWMKSGTKMRIDIDPYTIDVYQVTSNGRDDHTIMSIPTFMVDQVYVHSFEKIEKDYDTGKITKRYMVYELNAWTKDMKEKTILPAIKTALDYQYIESIIEQHLDISNRKMSRGNA